MASIKRKTFDDVENSPQKKKQRHSEESGETTSETADSEIPLPSEATGDTADSENPLPSEATGDTADSENPLPSEATSKTADSDVVEQENSSSRQETQSGPLVNTEKQEHNKRENAILPNETHTALDHVVYDDVKPEDAEKQEQAPTMSLPPRRKIRHPIGETSCQYSRLYRLLREDEKPKVEGIIALNPNANKSVQAHVNVGSNFTSQFISSSASMPAVRAFARLGFHIGKRIATINVDELTKLGDVYYVDLTIPDNRDKYRLEGRAVAVARKYTEVLILGDIPPTCIENITVIE